MSLTKAISPVYDGGGQMIAEYSTALATTPQVSYLTQDHLGSPRVITNENGKVVNRKEFMAYGDQATSSQRVSGTGGNGYDPADVRQDYTGYEKDSESGLEFAQARYYNPTHGRFTSVDPLTASASIKNPQTFNRYTYVLNSPYKFVDPLGLLPEWTPSRIVEAGDGAGTVHTLEVVSESNTNTVNASTALHETAHVGGEPEALMPEPPPQVGTIIIGYGQPGTGSLNAGSNFARAAATAQESLEAGGYTVINVGEVGNRKQFQGLLDTATTKGAVAILFYTHGAADALDIGDGPRDEEKDVTTQNVRRFFKPKNALKFMTIYGCNVGSSDNGVAQALASHLGIMVRASTTGQDFSPYPDRLSGKPGKHPDTGPTYMVPVGGGTWRDFFPK